MTNTDLREGDEFGDEDEHCDCACHQVDRSEYKLMLGSEAEGLSLREVFYNKDNEVLGWTPPICEPVSSIREVKERLVNDMHELNDMLDATELPIIDEIELEKAVPQD